MTMEGRNITEDLLKDLLARLRGDVVEDPERNTEEGRKECQHGNFPGYFPRKSLAAPHACMHALTHTASFLLPSHILPGNPEVSPSFLTCLVVSEVREWEGSSFISECIK